MPNSSAKEALAGENPEAPKDTVRSTRPILATIVHFRQAGQLRGFAGSFGKNFATSGDEEDGQGSAIFTQLAGRANGRNGGHIAKKRPVIQG